MAASQQLARVAPYARRLLDDDYVQDEFDRLFTSLRDGSRRARRKGPAQAATDRRLRSQLAAALAAAAHIARALNEPEAKPRKRHWVRRLLLLVVIACVAVGVRAVTAKGSVQRDD
jgi:hypothetical protein